MQFVMDTFLQLTLNCALNISGEPDKFNQRRQAIDLVPVAF